MTEIPSTHSGLEAMAQALTRALQRTDPHVRSVSGLNRLSGGASQETWSFDAAGPDGQVTPLILRRPPGGNARAVSSTGLALETEAAVIGRAEAGGVLAPRVVLVLEPDDGLGSGYVMARIPGETIPRKILRDAAFARARDVLARHCGEAAARIHGLDLRGLAGLKVLGARAQFEQYRDLYDSYDHPHPVFEVAFKWLDSRLPADTGPVLVHGDFRHGNLIVGPEGLRAVLDWELAHLGDPAEDLGWICVNSWRFGESSKRVGGFGDLEDLLAGYRSAGGDTIDPERVRFWEIFGTLKWGIMCMTMYQAYKSGVDVSVERAAIGRRSSETEIDLMRLIYGGGTRP